MFRLLKIFSIALCLATPVAADTFDPLNVYGQWRVESGNALVEITDCGDGTPCGTVAWINAPDPDIVLDDQNPDPDKRTNKMLGTKIVWGFRNDEHEWDKGQIYDAEGGKIYRSEMRLREDGTLKIKGCLGMFCQSQTWTRFELNSAQAE